MRTLLEYPHDYPISLGSFKLPGLGVKGRLCNHKRLDKFSEKGDAAYFKLMKCKRIECPSCFMDWIRRTVFDLTLKVEAYARASGTRPIAAIMSVHPQDVDKKWNWARVNVSLFQRGYRRIRDKGLEGGVAVFHPYRLNAYARGRWLRSRTDRRKARGRGDIAIWEWVRAQVQAGENLFKFVKLGPHVHTIGFGVPQPHSCRDYMIKFEGGYRRPDRLELKNVVGYLFYLATHVGVSTHLTSYRQHRSKRYREHHPDDNARVDRAALTHTIREFGSLFRLDPKELLGERAYNALASEIATLLEMEWKDGELGYPAFHKEFDISDTDIKWIPILELGKYLNNDAWLSSLTCPQQRFWLAVYGFMRGDPRCRRPPPELGDIEPPPDIAVYVEREGLADLPHAKSDYALKVPARGFHPDTVVHGPQPLSEPAPTCVVCRAASPVGDLHGASLCAACLVRVGG